MAGTKKNSAANNIRKSEGNGLYEKAVMDVIEEIGRREELSRKRTNVLGTGPDYRDAKSRLSECSEGFRCGLSACVECAHHFRFKYVVSALHAFKDCNKLYHVTILDECIELNELGADKYKPKNIIRCLKRKLKMAGFDQLKIFGTIDISYENNKDAFSKKKEISKGRFILHYHLVFVDANIQLLETLRKLFPNNQLSPRVKIQKLKEGVDDRVRVFSYCCKRTDYYKPKYEVEGRQRIGKPKPILLQYRRVLLNYLTKYRMSELQLHHNILFTKGKISRV